MGVKDWLKRKLKLGSLAGASEVLDETAEETEEKVEVMRNDLKDDEEAGEDE